MILLRFFAQTLQEIAALYFSFVRLLYTRKREKEKTNQKNHQQCNFICEQELSIDVPIDPSTCINLFASTRDLIKIAHII